MSRFRFTTAGHRALEMLNPIPSARFEGLLDALPLVPGEAAVDLGCGKAAALEALARRGLSGLGVDLNPAFLEEARARLAARRLEGHVELREGDLAGPTPDGRRAVAICMGARVDGSAEKTRALLVAWARPGGVALIGEGYWRRPPSKGYLALLGCPADAMGTHADNERVGADAGWQLIGSVTARPEDFDAYEGAYAAGVRAHLRAHPDDPEVAGWAERIDAWQEGYRRWGRETLGFGVYAYRLPG